MAAPESAATILKASSPHATQFEKICLCTIKGCQLSEFEMDKFISGYLESYFTAE
jgi:hypothetical protein